MTTKMDLINGAYSMGRISGLTVQATPEDITLALRRLENLMAEWADRNICLNYNFETSPDPTSTHNISKKYINATESNLMTRLLPDFGREPTPALLSVARTSFSRMASSLAVVPRVDYPSRQPRGSGNNRWNQFDRFFRPIESAPIECKTVQMVVGDISDFSEDFSSYLVAGEDIATWVLTADTELTVTNEALYPVAPADSTQLNYTVTATGVSSTEVAAVYQVKIIATTSDGRIETRLRNFELTDVEIG